MTVSYDAILIVSFGGPEGMEDVIPFLENVLRGRNVPRERMLLVAKRYELFGGVSPINEANRKLIAALQKELDAHGPHLPIYWGNRNWRPLLADTMRQMADDGIKRALGFVTSAYSSYSSCRQYLENIASAQEAVGPNAPRVDKVRGFYNHPGFIEASADNVRSALNQVPEVERSNAQIIFTAHSIPRSMADACEYEAQLKETARLISETLNHDRWQLVYQSRSGPPAQPWLGPDICDYLKELHSAGVTDAVIAPIGFVSDHMEVIYDLDTQARKLCEEMGLNMVRASTVGAHPAFIKMIRELILERTDPDAPKRFLGCHGAAQDVCAIDCCLGRM
jgi:protoporphyrin/coproporphyrin ferrochelatase